MHSRDVNDRGEARMNTGASDRSRTFTEFSLNGMILSTRFVAHTCLYIEWIAGQWNLGPVHVVFEYDKGLDQPIP